MNDDWFMFSYSSSSFEEEVEDLKGLAKRVAAHQVAPVKQVLSEWSKGRTLKRARIHPILKRKRSKNRRFRLLTR